MLFSDDCFDLLFIDDPIHVKTVSSVKTVTFPVCIHLAFACCSLMTVFRVKIVTFPVYIHLTLSLIH